MWFKNLRLFRLPDPLEWNTETLAERLAERRARPCGRLELSTIGWWPALGQEGQPLVHAGSGAWLLCAKREDRILPAAVVNEVTAARAAPFEEERGRPLRRKERQELRETVFQELLPQAFCLSSLQYGFLDPVSGWLVVDAGSAKRAEEWVNLLRETLGSLPVRPIAVRQPVSDVLTLWLHPNALPPDLAFGEECELRDSGDEGGVVRCRKLDLTSEDIQCHVKAGRQVVRLMVEWEGRLSLILDEDLAIRRLKFTDWVQEETHLRDDDALARFDAEFTLMVLELRRFLPRLLELFGGEASGEVSRFS
ncbi:MAG: recombination-associated protein RdgC [Pseudomonadota bacterium]